jgi:hypothetical protein
MKKKILSSLFAVTVSLAMAPSAFSQDVISDVKSAVVAESADIAAIVKAAAAANPGQAAGIAQAAVKALELKSNDAADEATIELIIQAAIEGSKAAADQAKSIRAVAESALLQPDSSSEPIQGGDTGGQGNPLDVPGVNPLGSPLSSFNEGGTAGGTTGGGGTGSGGLGSLLGRLPAGGMSGGFIGSIPSGGGDGPGAGGDLGGGNGAGGGGGLVNPPVVTNPAP